MTNKNGTSTCPACESSIAYFEHGLSCGWECSACGWTVVTTNQDHPAFDTTLYRLTPILTTENRKEFIASTAAFLGIDIKQARTRIDSRTLIADNLNHRDALLLQKRFLEKALQTVIAPQNSP